MTPIFRRLSALITITLTLAALALAVLLPQWATELRAQSYQAIALATSGVGGAPANGPSGNPALSYDGRFLVFESVATNLVVSGCTTGVSQIFLRDLLAGVIICVSVGPDGAPGNAASSTPAISGDGRVVAFVSAATNLVAGGCTTGGPQVFLRDLAFGGVTTCVSVGPNGVPGNAASSTPNLDLDGSVVVFGSAATNLVPSGCTTGVPQVFLRDRGAGTTTCASVGPNGVPGDAASGQPTVNAIGSVVAFESAAGNLVASGCTTGVSQVFIRNLPAGTTTCASVAPDGAPGNAASSTAVISADAGVVAFVSAATNLVALCNTPGITQIFVRDLLAGTTLCVSLGSDGFAGTASSGALALSGNGLVVAFLTSAGNLLGGGTGGSSAAGGVVAQSAAVAQMVKKNLNAATSAIELLSKTASGPANGSSKKPAMNFDGSVVVFPSAASNLVPGDSNGVDDIFVAVSAPQGSTRATIISPPGSSQFPLKTSTSVGFAWTSVAGASQYFFEFSGANRQFSNPNGTAPDPVNGSGPGGAGGSVFVAGTGFTAVLDPSFPLGTYQVRVIGLSAGGQAIGTFSNVLTLVLGTPPPSAPTQRVTIIAPVQGSQLVRATLVTFSWTGLPGVAQYGFEFTGPNRQFSNPNGTTPDVFNGFGGAGGGLAVTGTGFQAVIPPNFPSGTYQIRIIGLSPTGQLTGTFSDAVTVVVP